MEKIKIIINPSAGDEQASVIKNSLELIYQKKGAKISIYETKGNDDFKKVVQNSLASGYKKLVVSGGDGTISELVNGIAELKENPKIILIPSGTTNNFGRNIVGNRTKEEILKTIENEQLKEVKVDVGCINNQYFISSVAVGLLPTVGWEADDDLKAELGSFAYLFEGLKLMQEKGQESFNLRMQLKEQLVVEEDIFLFIVGLSNSIFGIKTFFDDGSVNDGKLHYFALKKSEIFPGLHSLFKQISTNKNKQKNDEYIIQGEFKEAVIDADKSFNFLIDGEKGPSFPVNLEILPEHLTFLVPSEE